MLLRRDPMISQQELADRLGIVRSSVGVHISNLMQKGYILGKGYIIAQENRAIVIGGANMDIFGFPEKELVPSVSNPGRVETSCGGVGRNIAENIARLGAPVSLVAAVGVDSNGEYLLKQCQAAGVDVGRIIRSDKHPTSTYIALQNGSGDMAWAVSQMDITRELSVEKLSNEESWIENGSLLVLDANIPEVTLRWILDRFRELPIWVDPVSLEKAKRLKGLLGGIHAIKPNRQEAALISGIPADDEDGVLANWEWFMKAGVNELWLSLGKEGLFFGNAQRGVFARIELGGMVNANGAGDAMMAGAVFGSLNGYSDEDRIRIALAAAAATCRTASTIDMMLSEKNLKTLMNEVTLYEAIS